MNTLSAPSPSALPKPLLLEALRTVDPESVVQMAQQVLEKSCSLLGAISGWVTCHAGGQNHAVLQTDHSTAVDLTVDRVLMNTLNSSHAGSVMIMPWMVNQLLCVTLSAGYETGPCTFMLCVMLDGHFILTAEKRELVECLRCSLQALIGRQISRQRHQVSAERVPTDILQPACSSCRMPHAMPAQAWSYCDFRFLTTAPSARHTLCEPCALELYRGVLQGSA